MADTYNTLFMWLGLVALAVLVWNNARKVKRLMATLDEGLEIVASQKTKLASWDAFWDNVRQQLADALSGVTLPPAAQAKVDALIDGLKENSLRIDESLAEGVPPTP